MPTKDGINGVMRLEEQCGSVNEGTFSYRQGSRVGKLLPRPSSGGSKGITIKLHWVEGTECKLDLEKTTGTG